MTKLFLVLTILIFINDTVWSNSLSDSLEYRLELSTTPQEKLILLKQFTYDLESTSDDEVFERFATRYLALSKEVKDTSHIAEAHYSIAVNHFLNNRLEEAAQYWETAATYYKTVDQINSSLQSRSKAGTMYNNAGDYEKAKNIYAQIIQEAESIDSLVPSLALANLHMGSMYFYRRLLDSAEVYYQASTQLYEQLNDTTNLLRPLTNLAGVYFMRGQFDSTFQLMHRVRVFREIEGDKQNLIVLYNNLSMAYKEASRLDSALYYAIAAYEMGNEERYASMKSRAFVQISSIYGLTEDYEAALKFANLAIEENGEEFLDGKVYGYLMRGEALSSLDSLSEAIESFTKGLELIEEKDIGVAYMSETQSSLAAVLLKNGDKGKAKQILLRLLDDPSINPVIVNKSNSLMATISWIEGDAKQTIAYGSEAFDRFNDNADYINGSELALTLSEAHDKNQDYQKALYYSRQHKMMSDSLNNIEAVKQLTRRSKDFEFELERQEIAANQAKKEALLHAETRQSRILAGGVGIIALLGMGFFWNAKRQNKIIARKNGELEELNSIKDQIFTIIGHDLRKPALAFNGLSRKVNYLLKKNDYEGLDKLGEQIETNGSSLQKIIDNLLNWALAQRSVVPYDPEVVNLSALTQDLILSIKPKLRDKNISLDNKIDSSQEVWSDKTSLYTVLLNILDNATKYTQDGGLIKIDAQTVDNQLKITVQDSGEGMTKEQINQLFLIAKDKSKKGTHGEKGTGLGMHVANELIKINKGFIQVTSDLGVGSQFDIYLPKVA